MGRAHSSNGNKQKLKLDRFSEYPQNEIQIRQILFL